LPKRELVKMVIVFGMSKKAHTLLGFGRRSVFYSVTV
jgi:hypothetical protein